MRAFYCSHGISNFIVDTSSNIEAPHLLQSPLPVSAMELLAQCDGVEWGIAQTL